MIKRILIKLPRKTIVDGRELVLSKFEKHMIKDTGKDYHMKSGIIKKEELNKPSGSLINLGNNEFVILDADYIDKYKSLKRLAQIITLKDIGFIITETGMNKKSVVLDAGLGSAALAIFLADIAKKVIAYDNNDEHISMARNNIKEMNVKNIIVKKGDIYNEKEITEKNIDVFTLDVPEPWNAVKAAEKVLKVGGFLVSYSPNLNQVQKFLEALPNKFIVCKTAELIEREWTIDDKRMKPRTMEIGHTGFLTVARKILK